MPTPFFNGDKLRVTIDPGHQRKENQGISGIYFESEGNLEFSLKLRNQLKKTGCETILTREINNTFVGLTQRAIIAAKHKSHLLISIHSDASHNPEVGGVHCIRSVNRPNNQILGDIMAQSVADAMGIGIRRPSWTRESTTRPGFDYYTVIDRSINFEKLYGWSCPYAFIIERGYHTNSHEEKLLLDQNISSKAAKALSDAIYLYFLLKEKGDNKLDFSAAPVLKRGSKDEWVRIFQESLMKLGYDLGQWGTDGIFGSATEEAVRKFQFDNSLTVDGIAGLETWNMLKTLVKYNHPHQPEPDSIDYEMQKLKKQIEGLKNQNAVLAEQNANLIQQYTASLDKINKALDILKG